MHVAAVAIGLWAWGLALPAQARAQAPSDDPDDWLAALYQQVADDVEAGAPLVVQVHVPLCENQIIWCGNERLGDGDNPRTNLYWSTSGGFVGWFKRKGSGWKQVMRQQHDGAKLLETRVWKRRTPATGAWRRRGVDAPFDVYVVAYAWRGTEIDSALEAFVADAYGDVARSITLPDRTTLAAGGAARVVAYVGHNRLMDIPEYDWEAAERRHAGTRVKAVIAVACSTAPYMADSVPSPRRVPLLMTRDLLFAGAHSFEGAVSAFARAASLARILHSAVEAYAKGQGKPAKRVRYVFTNPSDKRWNKAR